jgi:hypothetical protein
MSGVYGIWLELNDAERAANRVEHTLGELVARHHWEPLTHITDWEAMRALTTLDGYEFRPPAGFVEVEAWADSRYRVVYVSRQALALLTYCEGDLILERCPDQAVFQRAWEQAEAFYAGQATEEVSA